MSIHAPVHHPAGIAAPHVEHLARWVALGTAAVLAVVLTALLIPGIIAPTAPSAVDPLRAAAEFRASERATYPDAAWLRTMQFRAGERATSAEADWLRMMQFRASERAGD
jgi:hypothetical protein